MASRGTRKAGTHRMDGAIAALTPLGFSKNLIRDTIRELIKVYGDNEAGWYFVEENYYKLVIDKIIEDQNGENEEHGVKKAEISSGGDEDPSRYRSFLSTFRKKKKTITGLQRERSTHVAGSSFTSASTSTLLPSPPPPPPPHASPSFASLPTYSQTYHSPEAVHTTPFYPYHSYPSQPPPPPPPPYYHSAFVQPSYYPSPPLTPHPSPPIFTDRGAGQLDCRIYLVPEGDTFNPSKQATHKIRDIIRSKFDAPFISWKKIPPAVRDMWFREFEKDFRWLPEHNDRIRRIFERRGSTRLRDMFTDIRKSGERPLWIGEEVWADLNAQWGSPEYERTREQNRQNRASDVGGMGSSLHTGGSVPHTEHRRRMKEMLGRDPSTLELHTRTHQRQEDQQWVDTRSRHVHDEYVRLSQSQSFGEYSRRADFDIWREAAGGKKKGRIYGLGSQGIAYDAQSSKSGSSENTIEEMNALKRQVAAFTDKMNARMQVMQAEIQGLCAEQRRGKEQVQKSSKEEETEDDDSD